MYAYGCAHPTVTPMTAIPVLFHREIESQTVENYRSQSRLSNLADTPTQQNHEACTHTYLVVLDCFNDGVVLRSVTLHEILFP